MTMTVNVMLTSLETSLVEHILLLAKLKHARTTDTMHCMKSHQLLLNETKTETIVFIYARNDRVPPAITTVDVCGCHVAPQPTVRDIGIFDGHVDGSCAYM